MELDHKKREVIGTVMDGFLVRAKSPSWATLWYQPSKMNPETQRLFAVLDNPKTVKQLRPEQQAIEHQMKAWPETNALKPMVEIITTTEFHRLYQNQQGFELIREWNGDRTDIRKQTGLAPWLNFKSAKILMPVMVAGLIFLIIKLVSQAGL